MPSVRLQPRQSRRRSNCNTKSCGGLQNERIEWVESKCDYGMRCESIEFLAVSDYTRSVCASVSYTPCSARLTWCSAYQEILAKSLTERYNGLNSQLDRIIHEANREISDLRSKVDCMFLSPGIDCAIIDWRISFDSRSRSGQAKERRTRRHLARQESESFAAARTLRQAQAPVHAWASPKCRFGSG